MQKIILLLLLLTSCSSHNKDDPYEEFNKDMLSLNMSIDKNILKPPSAAYKDVTSEEFREVISNFLENLKEPYYFINYTISFDAENAVKTVFRFVANSLFGFFGFFDAGKDFGLEKSSTTYKNTLHRIGIPAGNYLMLPIIGANSTGYVIAEPISWFCDPITYFIGWPCTIAKTLIDSINSRAQNYYAIDSIFNDSIDAYSITKTMYTQQYAIKKEDTDTIETEFNNSPIPEEFSES